MAVEVYTPETTVKDAPVPVGMGAVFTDRDALENLNELHEFAEDQEYEHLAGTVRALIRLFAVRTEGFQDLAMYGAKVTYWDSDGEPHKALVFEPGVGEAPPGKYYDPNRDEYTTPEDYPLGTVNLIRASGGEDLLDDYISNVVTETSVTPADTGSGSRNHQYTPGW